MQIVGDVEISVTLVLFPPELEALSAACGAYQEQIAEDSSSGYGSEVFGTLSIMFHALALASAFEWHTTDETQDLVKEEIKTK